MNLIQLLRLLKTIYYGRPPDIKLIQSLGLLAVKIGQTYAQRADFLAESSCRELAKLYRQTTPIAADGIDSLIDDAVGEGWRASFRFLSREPLASASVGQVHKGVLLTGESVVVKVVRRDFRQAFEQDIDNAERILKRLVWIYPKLARVADPIGTLRHIGKSTLSELDLRNEVQGQHDLAAIYQRHREEFDLAKLAFPKIYEALSSERVMVSEFVKGPTFDELLESGNLGFETLLDLFEIHGFFLFCTGTFHGDIHPGNIILREGQIVFLDTGAISRVPAAMRRGLFRFFDALVNEDLERSALSLEAMSRTPLSEERSKRFQRAFQDLYSGFLGKSVAELSLSRQMMQTIRLAVDHGMDFETGMYPIVKSLMYLDGMVLRCAPSTDLMAELRPYLDRFRPWVEKEPEPESKPLAVG